MYNAYSEITMKKHTFISVVVASYNYDQYIKDTLNSLINQTNDYFEIIVVDDGSKDKSLQVIEEYARNYKNIKLYTHLNNQNRGLAETVKLGIEKANGDYIAFCESDDFWSNDHIEYLQNTIMNNPSANFIVNGIKVINLSSNPEYDSYINFSASFLRKHSGRNIFPHLNSNYIPTFSAVCVKKEVIEKANFNSPYPAWLDFWLWRQICVFNRVYYIPQELTFWRKHEKSYDATSSNKDFNGFIKLSDQYLVNQYGLTHIISNVNSKAKKKATKWFMNPFRQLIKFKRK